jgi:CRP-like cAMP-binding protein
VRIGRNQKIELIKTVPLFSRCSRAELAEVAMASEEVDLPEGKELIREGSRGREFFVLLEGSADVKRKGRRINQLKRGDFFGEIALVARSPRTATVVTSSPVSALVLTERSFRGLLERSPQIQTKVLEALAERLAPEAV